jgi:hypothetical protein
MCGDAIPSSSSIRVHALIIRGDRRGNIRQQLGGHDLSGGSAIVLGAFDDVAFDKAFAEVNIAMGTNSVCRKELTLGVSIQGIGLLAMVESNNIGAAQSAGLANGDPAFTIRRFRRTEDVFRCALRWLRQFPFHMISRIFHLFEHGWKYLSPRRQETRIRLRAVTLDGVMEPGQRMIGHQGKHVVLDVVVHVPVKEAVNRIHVHRPAVETVVQNVLRQTRVLREPVDDHKPRAKQVRQPNT